MTFATFDPLMNRSGRPRHSRVALALSHAISDSMIRPQVVPFGSGKLTGDALAEDWFATLLKQDGCQAAWSAYTDTTTKDAFPQQLAQGAAPLNGFRHYTIQDAMYLEYYVRVRMAAIGTWDSGVSSNDLWEFVKTIPDGLSYSTTTVSVCESQLGVPKSVVENELNKGKSQQLQDSIRYYESVLKDAIAAKGNAWLDNHFALLPCIRGYCEIAVALLKNPTTVRNSVYYTLWIEGNADATFVDEYNAFIGVNTKGATTEQWAHWGKIFKQACINEKNFFDLAIKGPPQYDIVKAGKYTISPYINNKKFLADSGTNVVVSDKPVQWELGNSGPGYSIKLGDKKFLKYDGQKVVISDQPTMWSLFPVLTGNNTYQLLPEKSIQLALDFDGTNTVSVANNNATTQTWTLTLSTAS